MMRGPVIEGAGVVRKAGVPLYQQIFTQLREEIVSGQRPLGSNMPTEHEIIKGYKVSRTTAKLALNKLADHNLVARERKIGTRVIFQSPMRPIVANISSTLETLATFGRETAVSILKIGMEPAVEPASKQLQVRPSTPILRIDRLRWLDGVPLGYTNAYVPEPISRTLTLADLQNTPLVTMIMGAGHAIGSAKQTIAAVLADAKTAAFLQMHPWEPLLRITRIYYDLNGSPLLLTRAFYRADRYQADVDLKAHSPALPITD